jgi:O-antigen/teichoic acid export membrane protein
MKKDVLIYFAGKIIPALVNLAIIILAVRFLGKAEYGRYSLVFYAVMLLSTLSFGWIQQSILRFLSAYPEEQDSVTNRFFFLTLISSILALLAGLLLCVFYFHFSWTDTAVVMVYILFYNLFLFHLSLNQAKRKSLHYAMLEGTYNLLFLVLFFVLVLMFNQRLYIVLFMAMVVALLLTEVLRVTVFHAVKGVPDISRIDFQRDFTKRVFSFGFPITIWLFLSYFLNISDRFIIKEFSNYENVGTYAAIKDFIIKIATFSTIPILLAYHPAIVEKWNSNRKQEAMRLVREGLTYCSVIALAVFIFFLFFQDLFYSRVLHLQVSHPVAVSAALVGSAFAWQAAMLLHKPLELLLKPKLMLLAIVSALAVNTLANLVFVPVFGYLASAVISMVSVLTYVIVIIVFLLRFRKQGLLR